MAKWLCACAWLVLLGGPLAAQPSRAAWWLAQDGVKPIADLVNTAEPGQPIRFGGCAGKFQVKSEDRALLIIGDFPEANIWRFGLMRKLYVAKSANCAYPDPIPVWTRSPAKQRPRKGAKKRCR